LRDEKMKTFWNFKIPIIVVFLCILTAPCLGHDPIQIIGNGGGCFIGESGLDISDITSIPGTSIGWWASEAHIGITPPDKTYTVEDPLNFFVDPSVFVGYEGYWYVVSDKTKFFGVKNPRIALSIEDVTTGTDITDGAIVPGDEIGFIIDNNFFSGDPGAPIDIIVTSPKGSYYKALVNKAGIKTSLKDVLVSSSPLFHTGAIWDTLNSKYTPGTYEIHAEITFNGIKDNYYSVGNTVSQTHTVTILPNPVAPKAKFISDITKGPHPLTVVFTDASKGTGPLTYAWDFNNDGTVDSDKQIDSFTYDTAGRYTVTLTVTNSIGGDTITKKNYITVK
jgi:hypothetical protein